MLRRSRQTSGSSDPPSYQKGSKYPWITELRPLKNFRLWIKYSDGIEGEVDLSDMAGTELFEDWQKPGLFEQVRIGDYGQVFWTEDASLCADALYIELTESMNKDSVYA